MSYVSMATCHLLHPPGCIFDSESGDSLSVNWGIVRPVIGIGIRRPGQENGRGWSQSL